MRTTLGPTPHVATSVEDDAVDTDAIADDAVTYAKVQNVSADERILGRVSGANGVIEELTKAQVLTFANVEDGADATDATNVTAAGALMDSELAGIAAVKATTGTFLSADESKLDGIEASATADQTAGQILTLLEDGIDSVHYEDGSIDTIHIADNNVTAAKIFDLARGSVLIGNASAATAELTVGSDNYVLTVDSSGDIGWEAASGGGISTTLTSGNILVGNGSNVATSVNPQGDVDVTNAGVFSITDDIIINTDIKSDAAIAISKTALVAGTNITLSTNTLAVDDAFIKNDANDTTTGIITSAGLAVTDSKYAQFSSTAGTPGTDNSVQGIVIEFLASETVAQFDAVYLSTTTGRVGKADAAVGAVKVPAIGVAIEDSTAGNSLRVLTHGVYRDDDGFGGAQTVGVPLYCPEGGGGDLTVTAPSTDGDMVQRMGVMIGTRSAFINPSMDAIEHA